MSATCRQLRATASADPLWRRLVQEDFPARAGPERRSGWKALYGACHRDREEARERRLAQRRHPQLRPVPGFRGGNPFMPAPGPGGIIGAPVVRGSAAASAFCDGFVEQASEGQYRGGFRHGGHASRPHVNYVRICHLQVVTMIGCLLGALGAGSLPVSLAACLASATEGHAARTSICCDCPLWRRIVDYGSAEFVD